MSTAPFAGGLPSVGRMLLPSNKDKAVAQWRNDVTAATNEHADKIESLEAQILTSSVRLDNLDQTVSAVRETVRLVKPDIGIFEGELENYRLFIESGQVRTALSMLERRYFADGSAATFPGPVLARAKALAAFCHHQLDDDERAAVLFQDAYDLDPNNPKLAANRVLGYLLAREYDDALAFAGSELARNPTNEALAGNYVHAHRLSGVEGDPVDVLEPAVRQSASVTHALLQFYRHRKSDWHGFAADARKRLPDDDFVRVYMAEGELEDVIRVTYESRRALTAREIDQASKAADVLRQSWERHRMTERAITEVEIATLHNSLLGFIAANRQGAAMELIETAMEYVERHSMLRRLAVMVATERGDRGTVERLLSNRFENDFDLRLNFLIHSKRWDQAIELIEDDRAQPSAKNVVGLDAVEECLRHLATRPDDVEDTFRNVLESVPDAASALTVSRLAEQAEATAVAADAYRKALSFVSDRTSYDLRVDLANDAYRRRDVEAVVELLSAHVDPTHDTPERARLANSYVATFPRERAKQFFQTWRKAGTETFELNFLEACYHFNRNAPEKALPFFRKALRDRPNELQVLLALWQTLKRVGRHAEAARFMARVDPEMMDGAPVEKLHLAHLLWQEGRTVAFELAYDVAVANQDDAEICAKYSGLFLLSAQEERQIPVGSPSIVGEDVWVRLESGGKAIEFVISGKPAPRQLHRGPEDPFVRAAMGHSVEDQLDVSIGPLTERWRVAALKDKKLALFHNLSNDFQNRFPHYPGFLSLTMNENDVSPLLDIVRERAEQAERILSDYKEKRLPLGIAARLMGTNTIEFGIELARAGQKLICSIGTDEAGRVEYELARQVDPSRGVVLDAYTAWFLGSAGLLGTTKQLFGKLVVPQTVTDLFDRLVADLPERTGRSGTLAFYKGHYVFTEADTEVASKERDYFESLRRDIAAVCDVVGTEIGEGLSKDLIRLLPGLHGALDAIVVADRENLPILSADLHLRYFASIMAKRPAFGLRGLLALASEQSALSATQLAEAVTYMGQCGHNHLPLNAPVLHDVLELDRADSKKRFSVVANYMGGENADYGSHMTVAATFLSMIAHDFPFDQHLQRAASAIFLGMVRLPHHAPRDVVERLVSASGANLAMRAYGSAWLRGHFLQSVRVTTEPSSKSPAEEKGEPT